MSEEICPLVTIGIPTYNSANYLEETLDSIALQTYKNIEVIISDNASSDDTVKIVNKYQKKYGWHLVLNQTNIGAGNNFNQLIDLARGDFLAIYHADDVYEPDIVSEAVQILNDFPQVGIVGTLSREIDKSGEVMKSYKLPDPIRRLNKRAYSFDETMLGIVTSGYDSVFFVTPSVMARRSVYQKLGGFKITDRYRSALDYEMWLRASCSFQVAIIDKHLIRYRIHENQGSELEIRKNVEVHDIVNVVNDYIDRVQDKTVYLKARNFVDNGYITAAIKQNALKLYSKSNESLSLVECRYSARKYLLTLCNMLKFNATSGSVRRLYDFLRLRGRLS